MSGAATPSVPARMSVACEEAVLEIAARNGAETGVHRRRLRVPTDAIVRALVTAGFARATPAPEARKAPRHHLTEAGTRLLKRIVRRRHLEDEGRPLDEWDPRRDTDSPRPEEFADYAVLSAESKSEHGSLHYHTDGKLMLLGPHPDPKRQVEGCGSIDAGRVADPMLWNAERVEPVGYLFDRTTALIAFSLEGVYLAGSSYETIVARTREKRAWYALTATAGLVGADEDDRTPSAIRCDADDVTGVAWSALYKLERGTPAGIRRLLTAAAGTRERKPK